MTVEIPKLSDNRLNLALSNILHVTRILRTLDSDKSESEMLILCYYRVPI